MSEDAPGLPDFIGPDAVAEPSSSEPHPGTDTQPTNPASSIQRKHTRTIVIVGVIVLALVAAGLTTWLTRRNTENHTFPCASATVGPDYTQDGPLQTMAVALADGEDSPTHMTVAGVWCGVAVVDLKYTHYEALSTGGYTNFDTDVLRAVDISTGHILWTMDASPDGSQLLLQSVLESDGKLALATVRFGSYADPATETDFCTNGSDVRILNLRSGRTLASSSTTGQCAVDPDSGFPVDRFDSVVAYQSGIVVLEDNTGPAPTVWSTASTAGYRDTDLNQPLWRVWPTGINVIGLDTLTDRTLPGGWVRTDSGDYVSIATGEPAGATNVGDLASWFTAGDLALEADSAMNEYADFPNPWFTALSAWSDLMQPTPAWTYTPPAGWVIAHNVTLDLGSTMDTWIGLVSSATPVVSVTTEAVVIMEQRFTDFNLTQARLTAIDKTDGQVQWSIPYGFTPQDLVLDTAQWLICPPDQASCSGSFGMPTGPGQSANGVNLSTLPRPKATTVSAGGQDYLVYATPQDIKTIDAATGQAIGSVPKVNAIATSAIYPCGESSACVAIDGLYAANYSLAGTDIVVVNISGPAPSIVSDNGYNLAKTGSTAIGWNDDGLFPTDAGLFAVVRHSDDYQLVLI